MRSRWTATAALALVVACDAGSASVPSNQGGQSGVTNGAPAGAASSGEGASGQHPEDLVDAGTGTHWSDLYRDFFGPTAPSSCAGTGTCHGAADQSGARSSGYVCATQDGCRESMLSLETGLVQTSDAAEPGQSTLVTMLRRRDGKGTLVGSMPKQSQYVFSAASLDRIESWIRNGAPND